MNARRVALLFALGGAAVAGAGLVATSAGCRTQTLAARSNFVEDGVHEESDAGWDAERVEIDNRGVTPTGGLALSASDTDRVSATARMLTVADTTDKQSADRAIASAQEGFVVTSSNGVTTVRCGHGQTFGSAMGDQTGCDALDVSVPKGAPEKPLAVVARSGNGKVVVSFDGAVLGELDLHASHGTVDVKTSTTQGSTITVVSETGDDVMLHLPRDFAADAIVLETATDKIDTSAFPDLQLGKGRGEAGKGAKSITVRAVAGTANGRIVLVPQQ
jgi:hypothetical protein